MPSTSTYIPSKVYKQQLLFSAFQSVTGVVAVWPMMRMGTVVSAISGGYTYDLAEVNSGRTYGRHSSGGPYVTANTGYYLQSADAVWNSPTSALTFAGYVQFSAEASVIEIILGKWYSLGNQRSFNFQRQANGALSYNVTPDGTSGSLIGMVGSVIGTSWTFVAGRYTPSTEIAVWVNATKAAGTTSVPAAIYDSTAPMQFGAFNGSSNYMSGNIGIIGMYAAAVPDAEISALYSATKGFYGL